MCLVTFTTFTHNCIRMNTFLEPVFIRMLLFQGFTLDFDVLFSSCLVKAPPLFVDSTVEFLSLNPMSFLGSIACWNVVEPHSWSSEEMSSYHFHPFSSIFYMLIESQPHVYVNQLLTGSFLKRDWISLTSCYITILDIILPFLSV